MKNDPLPRVGKNWNEAVNLLQPYIAAPSVH